MLIRLSILICIPSSRVSAVGFRYMRIQLNNNLLFREYNPMGLLENTIPQDITKYNSPMVRCDRIQLPNTIPQWEPEAGNLFLSLPYSPPPSRTKMPFYHSWPSLRTSAQGKAQLDLIQRALKFTFFSDRWQWHTVAAKS